MRIYLALTRTRLGTAIRAVAVDPVSAQLVAIDVRRASAFAFALGGALVAAAGVLVSMFLTFNAAMGVEFTMKALIVVIMGGVGNLLGALARGPSAGHRRDLRRAAGRSRPDARGDLCAVPRRAAVAADRPVRESRALSGHSLAGLVARLRRRGMPRGRAAGRRAAIELALGISLLSYTVLATAWALFSGPTRYISLATVAFFGIGAYTVGVLGEALPWPLVLAVAAAIGVAVALVVGLSTLRLSGMYFVIFTFGLAELIRQLVTWYEVNVHKLGRPLCLRRHHAAGDLLAAARARRSGACSPAG